MDDFEREQERHQRHIMLMRMAGETNRMETRMHIMWAVTVVLVVAAMVLTVLQ